MNTLELRILETALAIALYLLLRVLFTRAVDRITRNFQVTRERRRVILRIINLILVMLEVIAIAGIWGVNQTELFLFFTSTLTVLGIAFFAQWSFLSNITAGMIIFFNHPLKLGDEIRITEKDYLVEGKLESITFFFMHIRSLDGEMITIPNTIALQKTITILPKKDTSDQSMTGYASDHD